MEQIIHKIQLLVEEIALKPVNPDQSLVKSKLIDSMGIVDLALLLEREFNLSIDIRDIIVENFDTVNKIAQYIKERTHE